MKITAEPMAVLLFLGLLLTDRTMLAAAIFSAAAIHEAGHLWAAHVLRIPVCSLKFGLLGARLGVGRLLSYREEWLLALSGPFASMLPAILLCRWWNAGFLLLLSQSSFALGLLNLLPVRSFDGGRMLSAFLCGVTNERIAGRVLSVCSFLCLFLLWSLSVYLLLRAGSGLSLLSFSVSLFLRFFEDPEL